MVVVCLCKDFKKHRTCLALFWKVKPPKIDAEA